MQKLHSNCPNLLTVKRQLEVNQKRRVNVVYETWLHLRSGNSCDSVPLALRCRTERRCSSYAIS